MEQREGHSEAEVMYTAVVLGGKRHRNICEHYRTSRDMKRFPKRFNDVHSSQCVSFLETTV